MVLKAFLDLPKKKYEKYMRKSSQIYVLTSTFLHYLLHNFLFYLLTVTLTLPPQLTASICCANRMWINFFFLFFIHLHFTMIYIPFGCNKMRKIVWLLFTRSAMLFIFLKTFHFCQIVNDPWRIKSKAISDNARDEERNQSIRKNNRSHRFFRYFLRHFFFLFVNELS